MDVRVTFRDHVSYYALSVKHVPFPLSLKTAATRFNAPWVGVSYSAFFAPHTSLSPRSLSLPVTATVNFER